MITALLLAAAALLLLALGLMIWQGAGQRAQRRASALFVERQIRQHATTQSAAMNRARATAESWHGGPSGWNNLLLRAGIKPSGRFHARFALQILLPPLVLWGIFNGLTAAAALTLLIPLSIFTLWVKASRRHRQIVRQLPDFLDTVVRMMTVGHSLASAFQAAADRTTDPLYEVLQQARRAGSVGVELDRALRQTARSHGLYELYLIAAIVGVASRVGGRTDHVLERMSAFMRDLTQAREELLALSAETRLSAWILALLPLGIAALIISTNRTLIMGLWQDALGRKLLLGAVALQAIGSIWLYRLSRLR